MWLRCQRFKGQVSRTVYFAQILTGRHVVKSIFMLTHCGRQHLYFRFISTSDFEKIEIFLKISAWNGFVARSAASWETLATVWIRGLERGGVVYYEDLRSDTQVQLIRLVKMIGIKSIDQQRLKCAIRHKDGNQFKRKNRPEYIKYRR